MLESAPGASTSAEDETDELLRALARSPDRAPPPAPGTIWGESGRYVIESRLGRGGMGVVYVARDTLLERRVALKVLSDKVEESSRRRLLGEARVAASIEHDRVARIYDVGEHDGISFVAMELVRGVTLRAFAADRRVGASDIVHLGFQIAEGLAALHGDGIIHRDLKPENIMLSERQGIKLLDFGLARQVESPQQTAAGLAASETGVSGTPGYIAPEALIPGRVVDARVDIFAFGVILFELVTGRRPFAATNLDELLAAMQSVSLNREEWIEIPAALKKMVSRALAFDPSARFADGAALVIAFQELRAHTPTASLVPVEATRELALADTVIQARSHPRKSSILPLLGAASLVVVFAVIASTVLRSRPGFSHPAVALSERAGVVAHNDEAKAAYDSAVRLLRGGSLALASKGFAKAVEKDPEMAAAHLRLATYGMVADELTVRQQLAKARERQSELSPEDVAALDVDEADQADPDPSHHEKRWADIARRFPADAEIALEHALALEATGDSKRAGEEYERALALDPALALALFIRGVGNERRGDLAQARSDFDRCLEIAPGAASCLRRRAILSDQEGDCDAFVRAARRMTDGHPDDPQSYLFLSRALAANGESVESVRLARRRASALFGPPWAESIQDQGEMLVAQWSGDLDTAERLARSLDRRVIDHVNEYDHELPTSVLLAILEEEGRTVEAQELAERYTRQVPAWTGHETISRSAVLRALKHASRWPVDRYGVLRADWLAALQAKHKLDPGGDFAWIAYYAVPAVDRTDALEALDALPALSPLPSAMPAWPRPIPFEEAIGRVYLLADRPSEARPYLQRAARFCSRMEAPFSVARAQLELAQVDEQLGDHNAACAGYRAVARGGHLANGARTTAATSANQATTRLGCDHE